MKKHHELAVGSDITGKSPLRPDQIVSDLRRANQRFPGFDQRLSAESNLHSTYREQAMMVNNQAFSSFGMAASNLPYQMPSNTYGQRPPLHGHTTRPDSSDTLMYPVSGTVPGLSYPAPQLDPVLVMENNFFRKHPSMVFPHQREASTYLARQNYLAQRGDLTGNAHMNHPSFSFQHQNLRIPKNQNTSSHPQHLQKSLQDAMIPQDVAKTEEDQGGEKSKKKRTNTGRPAQDEAWYAMFERLLQFKAENGHCIVPVRYRKDIQLGAWVRNQRIRKGSSSQERVRLLDSIGFNWSVKEQREQHLWRTMFTRLLAFRDKHGHCKVPQRYRDDPQLGTWVHNQRLRKTRIPNSRRVLLDSVGFAWQEIRCVDK